MGTLTVAFVLDVDGTLLTPRKEGSLHNPTGFRVKVPPDQFNCVGRHRPADLPENRWPAREPSAKPLLSCEDFYQLRTPREFDNYFVGLAAL